MAKTSGKPIQLIFHGIRFVPKHLKLLERRATTSAGKAESILRGIAEKMSPFLPSLSSTCLDCFLNFVLTCHGCVTAFIKCLSLLLFYFTSCLDISEWKAFLSWQTLPFVKC